MLFSNKGTKNFVNPNVGGENLAGELVQGCLNCATKKYK